MFLKSKEILYLIARDNLEVNWNKTKGFVIFKNKYIYNLLYINFKNLLEE